MVTIARTVHIDSPPDQVWRVLIDVEGRPKWATHLRSLERQDVGPFEVGSRVKVTGGMPGAVLEVTAFDPGRSYTWTTQLAPGLRLIARHVVEAEDGGTRATFALEATGPLAALGWPVLSLIFRRNTRLTTEGLKAYCEGGAA